MLQDNLTERPDQPITTGIQIALLMALIAIGAIGLLSLSYIGDHDRDRVHGVDARMPIANPPPDPNRPDLFEEPVIEK